MIVKPKNKALGIKVIGMTVLTARTVLVDPHSLVFNTALVKEARIYFRPS